MALELEQEEATVTCDVDVAANDAYWQQAHCGERYYSPRFDYEDYAPAYCVGYTGFAQYGGTFEEAEKSLVSNWVRIKGDSKLGIDLAMLAMRAAWEEAAGVR